MGSTTHTRYLLTYEESIAPYSLRLPTYRSSYIRRFHPYARYMPTLCTDDEMDDENEDPGWLDLSILSGHPPPLNPAAPEVERAVEDHVERGIREQTLPIPGEAPFSGKPLCNSTQTDLSKPLDIFRAESQNVDEGLPSTLSVSGQRSSCPAALAGMIETREEQSKGEETREHNVGNPQRENGVGNQLEPEGEPLLVDPGRVYADLKEEDALVEDLRLLGLYCRVDYPTI